MFGAKKRAMTAHAVMKLSYIKYNDSCEHTDNSCRVIATRYFYPTEKTANRNWRIADFMANGALVTSAGRTEHTICTQNLNLCSSSMPIQRKKIQNAPVRQIAIKKYLYRIMITCRSKGKFECW